MTACICWINQAAPAGAWLEFTEYRKIVAVIKAEGLGGSAVGIVGSYTGLLAGGLQLPNDLLPAQWFA